MICKSTIKRLWTQTTGTDESIVPWDVIGFAHAIERQVLERAAQKCDEEAKWLEDLTEHEQACGAHKCAFEIRAMQNAQSSEEKKGD
jgi:hypothetical protein